jgi:hypothetical protein
MASTATNFVKALSLIVLGLAIAAMGIYVARIDDALGAAVMGVLLLCAAVVLGVLIVRNRLSQGAGRTALVAGVLLAAFAAFLVRAVTIKAPLFAQAPDVPSVCESAPEPQWAAVVERARPIVRAAVTEQNLPGVSLAVGVDDVIVWAEGFGWRDVVTHTPVTPGTRFHVGTAASVVAPADLVSFGMTHTGKDATADWSPGHIGEPEDDFPPFTFVHDNIMRPLGIADPAEPLPGERATFYVPRSDDDDPRGGRKLMRMRDFACCADGAAFSSTPSDLVRFAQATKADALHGELAGGSVMSLVRRDTGIVVAVTSNVAYADTAALAQRVAEVFAEPR